MPNYFFDIADGKHHVRDERGRHFVDDTAAVREAKDLLIVLKDLQELQRRTGLAIVIVRNHQGSLIYEGSIGSDAV